MSKRAIGAPRLYDGRRWLDDHAVLLDGARIQSVVPCDTLPAECELLWLEEGSLAPGLVDLQVNGGGGLLLNNAPDAASLQHICDAHRATGTTAMMATVLSDTREVQEAALAAVITARAAGNTAVLGLHIEGPFFAPAKRGTHHPEMIRRPDSQDLDWLCDQAGCPLMLTLAPEQMRPGDIARLSAAGVLVCAGHTNATYDQVQAALGEGLRGFTHLFNAMSQFGSREPGVVGAALEDPRTWAWVIADGHHVHPASLRIAHRAKQAGKLCLVSDAMATVGATDKQFSLYGERIREQAGRLVNAAGALAGSAIGMIDAVRYSHEVVGIELGECLNMASTYPAAFLGQADLLGRLAAGFRADLVHFDSAFRVHNTWLAGERRSHR
jgi:N-acetylglucosamine-6-phosphate deacetylase